MKDDKSRQKQTLHDRGICVVIPTYNNAGTIKAVVESTLAECCDVIVVNDGSTDATTEILQQQSGITLVSYAKNRGKGYALRRGFEQALSKGFAYAITLDGDGQHHPSDIALFLKANQEHPGALIVGSRNISPGLQSKGSRFANRFSNFWFYIQTGRKLADTQTGYRLYPLRRLHGLSLLTSRYEAELELLVFSSWHGTELFSIPIDVYYPPKEQRVSHFRPGMDFARISVLNTVLCFLAVVYGLPMRIARTVAKYVRTWYSMLFFLFFCMVVITPLTWLYVKTRTMTEERRMRLHRLIQWTARFVMIKHGIPGTRFSYKVDESVDFTKPHIIICNHQSHLDLMCQLVFSPKMVFLTKDWVWNNPTYGFLIRQVEYYPVAEGIEALMPKLRSLVERGYSIAVYPEGTRSRTCKIGRFHQGAFYLAGQLGIGILPMYLYGPGKVLPPKTYTLQKSPIYIEVGKPITLDSLQAMGDTLRQASTLRKHYVEKYESICNEVEKGNG